MKDSSKDKCQKTPQLKKFTETASALKCDENEERFNEKLGKIARQKPNKEKTER
jgi:hypothetical protein